MKKVLFIITCILTIGMSSCTKQYLSPGTTNQTVYADVKPSDWTLYTDNSGSQSYSVPITVSQLDNYAASSAGVIVAISYDGGSTYEQLPEVYANISYSFIYSAGNLSIYAQTADGSSAVQPTLPIKVKIILVDSNG